MEHNRIDIFLTEDTQSRARISMDHVVSLIAEDAVVAAGSTDGNDVRTATAGDFAAAPLLKRDIIRFVAADSIQPLGTLQP